MCCYNSAENCLLNAFEVTIVFQHLKSVANGDKLGSRKRTVHCPCPLLINTSRLLPALTQQHAAPGTRAKSQSSGCIRSLHTSANTCNRGFRCTTHSNRSLELVVHVLVHLISFVCTIQITGATAVTTPTSNATPSAVPVFTATG